MAKIYLFIIGIINIIKTFFENAGGLANFCTIFLFGLFVIGKLWVIWRNRSLYNENIKYIEASNKEEFNKQFVLEKEGQEVIEISSPEGIYDINIYEVKLSENGKLQKDKKISKLYEDNINHPLRLNVDKAVYIRTDLPCGAPKYMVEIKKYDYSVVTAFLGYNGKVGGVELIDVKIKRNIMWWLYYLCR